MLTEFQKRKISNLFAVHDLNHDGTLERNDFVEYTQRFTGKRGFGSDSPEHQKLLDLFLEFWEGLTRGADSDHDKKVSLQEWFSTFDRMLSSPQQIQAIQPLGEAVFNMLDRNGDGKVTLEEYRWLYSSGALDPMLAADSFKRIDRDHDGRVSPAELSDCLREFLLSNDANAPGNWLFGPV